jgi:hypothetical protein
VQTDNPFLDLYELDLINTRHLEGLERYFAGLERLLKRHPDEDELEGQIWSRAGSLIPGMWRHAEQLGEQVNQVAAEVRQLPSYQVDWPEVHRVARRLHADLGRLQLLGEKSAAMLRDEEQRRTLRELNLYIEQKTARCMSLGG